LVCATVPLMEVASDEDIVPRVGSGGPGKLSERQWDEDVRALRTAKMVLKRDGGKGNNDVMNVIFHIIEKRLISF